MVHQAFSVLRQVSTLDIGVIAIVHDLNLASQYADKIVLIHQKNCQFQGPAKDIIQADIINEVFSSDISVIQHPSKNFPLVVA